MSISYRKAEESDRRLIENSWLESFRSSHVAGLIAMDDWHEVMLPQIRKVLDREGVEVLVAHNPDDDSETSNIYGWAAVERGYEISFRGRRGGRWVDVFDKTKDPLVHYVFVKQPFRKLGIAKSLLAKLGVTKEDFCNYTCKTAVLSKIAIPNAYWKPLIARHTKNKNPRRDDVKTDTASERPVR